MTTSALQSFRTFLVSKSYSSSTIRNYLSDLNTYFEFISNPSVLRTAPLDKGANQTEGFNSEILSAYLKTISSDPNYRRYLSSLSKFFQFALDQGLIKTNPLKAALRDKKPSSDEIINQYSEYLNKKQFSESTIKNYLNDIRQFIDWSKSPDSLRSSAPFDERGPKKNIFKLNFHLPFVKGRNPKGEGFES